MSETRKLAAILVADVVGYSRLARADEERTLARLRGLRSDLIDPAIAAHHGRIVKRTGDGSIIEFRSVVDAVRCAIEVQNGLIERNAGVPEDRRIEFRIGIHLGDVVEESDGDLMGDGVNIAARLESIAKPGAICLSEQAYWQVKGRLDLAVTDLGPTELKNIAEPIQVYSLQIGIATQAKPAEQVTPAAPMPQKRGFGLAPLAAALAALLVVVAGGAWWFLNPNRPASFATKLPAEAARLSIVVTPFANLSGDPAQDSFADALTDELTSGLARVRGNVVIAHSTARAYRSKPVDVKALGKKLGVRYALEGSLQSISGQARVNVQLIDTESGANIWADQFDAPAGDMLQTQDKIVGRLARGLYLRLPEAETGRLKRTPSAIPDAEDLALDCQARALKNDFVFQQADSSCERALDADPDNVRALTWSALRLLPSFGRGHDKDDDLKGADVLLSKALARDPGYAPAHLVKAFLLQSQFRIEEAIVEDRRALELDPSLADAYWHIGFLMRRIGQFQASLESIDKAIWLSPDDPSRASWLADKAGTHLALKQYDHAIESARRGVAADPDQATPHFYLAVALALSGKEAQASEALQRYMALPGTARTLAGWNSTRTRYINEQTDPLYIEYWSWLLEGLQKAGMPEE
jgi:class 3 adenylate cyclase/TolB-like protein